jgi:DNA adenine methylase
VIQVEPLLPILKWAGGKRWLCSRFPYLFDTPYERYVEPFLGGAAAFFAMQPRRALLSDLNSELIATYRTIRAEPREVYSKLRIHQNKHLKDNSYYYEVRSSAPSTNSSCAAKFIYLNRTCFNGLYRVNLSGEFNVPKGTKYSVLFDTDDFESVARLLKRAALIDQDFEDVLDRCAAGDFAFVDPPYTAKHNENGFLKYNEKIFSWDDQRRLAACILRFKNRGGKALVANAAHESVIDLYRRVGEGRIVSRASVLASETKRRGSVEELIVTVGYRAEADEFLGEMLPRVRGNTL